jgi:hypothetical protein
MMNIVLTPKGQVEFKQTVGSERRSPVPQQKSTLAATVSIMAQPLPRNVIVVMSCVLGVKSIDTLDRNWNQPGNHVLKSLKVATAPQSIEAEVSLRESPIFI